jgi:hypothetical protein
MNPVAPVPGIHVAHSLSFLGFTSCHPIADRQRLAGGLTVLKLSAIAVPV